ncbi:MAG TPA: M20/M25/M40 family metallo-hydrolase [Oligoflexia bacterium]|nr:M20/M25/M40 family metallo-hydrolase [Oligoflexia bacterium]HMR24945.1 M20/M25/M40 family metallo-hydrolase [Oligoflexia bacterium]
MFRKLLITLAIAVMIQAQQLEAAHISYFNVSPQLAAVKVSFPDQQYWAKKLPIRGWLEDYIIIEWNQDSQKVCDALDLQATVFSGLGRFWIISHLKAHNLNVLYSNFDIVLEASDSLLLKATQDQAFFLVDLGYHIEELNSDLEKPIASDALYSTQVFVNDQQIEEMVAQVDSNAIDQTVQDLVNFGTRKANTQGGLSAQEWVRGQYAALGITDVSLFPVDNQPTHHDNIIAVYPGMTHPDEIIVVGGHYDSILSGFGGDTFAPGADDNASGTAGVLEAARILSQYDFEKTIIFAAFASEEYGLLGSKSYAGHLNDENENVIAMINLDMIGYLQAGDAFDLDIVKNTGSQALYNLAKTTIEAYVPNLPVVEGSLPPGASSDHKSFWNEGYPAVFFFEDSNAHSNFIHSTGDTIGQSYNNSNLAKAITQATVATVATLAVPYQTTNPTPTPVPTPDTTPPEQNPPLYDNAPSIQSNLAISACQQQSASEGFALLLMLFALTLFNFVQTKRS